MKEMSVLLFALIIFTSLSGCVEESNSEVSVNVNQTPVIIGSLYFDDYYDSQNNSTMEDVLWIYATAIDYDGQVVQWGVDTNNDGFITEEELEVCATKCCCSCCPSCAKSFSSCWSSFFLKCLCCAGNKKKVEIDN